MVYKSIVNLLKNKINSPSYNIGDLLPAEKELTELYDVSCGTPRKALKTLEEDGLIERRRGSETWTRNEHFRASVTYLDSLTEIARNQGKAPSNQALRFELQPASEEITCGLRSQHGEVIYYAKRLCFTGNTTM